MKAISTVPISLEWPRKLCFLLVPLNIVISSSDCDNYLQTQEGVRPIKDLPTYKMHDREPVEKWLSDNEMVLSFAQADNF